MVTVEKLTSPALPRGGSNRRWFALGALALSMLTIGLDTTVLAVALPTLANDLGASTSQLQWFSAAYTLVLAALLLPAGDLGDRLGHKRLLIGGLAVFGLASLACAFATSPTMLIADRAVLGIGAAVMMPLSMAVLPTLFPDAADRQRALTIWVTATSLGLPLGPIVGGWLLEHFWWGSVFLINVPVVLIGIAAIVAFVPSSRGSVSGSFDVVGAALSSVGLLGLTYGLIDAGRRGWSDPLSIGAMALGAVLLVVFVFVERGRTHPLVDPRLFRSGEFGWGSVLATLAGFLMFGIIFTVPQYSQAVLGTGPMGTGLRLLPLIAGLVVGARGGAMFMRRLAPGVLIAGGFGVLAVSGLLGALTTVSSGYGFVAIWLVLAGAGFGLVMPVAMSAALAALPVERAGSGSGLIQALRQAGGTIGVAVLGTVLGHGYVGRLHLPDSVPAALRERAGESVSAGVAVARTLGGDGLVLEVQKAFMHGVSLVMLTSAVLAVGSILLALVTFGRSRATTDADRTQSVHVE
jgi:EmrB/QacA subfamily drug resistance transporter